MIGVNMVKAAYDRSYVANLSQPFASKAFAIEKTIDGLEFYFWLSENWMCSLKCISLLLPTFAVSLEKLDENQAGICIQGANGLLEFESGIVFNPGCHPIGS